MPKASSRALSLLCDLCHSLLSSEVSILFYLILSAKSNICVKKQREGKFTFPHTPAESKFFLPLVFTKMLLSAKGIRKNSILTSRGNKEFHKAQVSLFFLPWLVMYYSAEI